MAAISGSYRGRDLAHLAALAKLTSLRLGDVVARAQAETLEGEYRDLLLLSKSHYLSKVPPERVVAVHKVLLEEVMGEVVLPSVRGLFE